MKYHDIKFMRYYEVANLNAFSPSLSLSIYIWMVERFIYDCDCNGYAFNNHPSLVHQEIPMIFRNPRSIQQKLIHTQILRLRERTEFLDPRPLEKENSDLRTLLLHDPSLKLLRSRFLHTAA